MNLEINFSIQCVPQGRSNKNIIFKATSSVVRKIRKNKDTTYAKMGIFHPALKIKKLHFEKKSLRTTTKA